MEKEAGEEGSRGLSSSVSLNLSTSPFAFPSQRTLSLIESNLTAARPPRDMIASGLGTGYGGGWDDKPTAGAGVASSNVLAYGGNEKMGFDRSNSAREYEVVGREICSRKGLIQTFAGTVSLRPRPPGPLS